jgi:ribose transport system permease protein
VSAETTGLALPARPQPVSRTLARGFSKYGTIIALVLMFIGFSIDMPGLFLSRQNLTNILSEVAIGGIIACGLTVCLAAGEFDLSIGYNTSFAGVLATGFMSFQHLPIVAAIIAALAVGMTIGVVNGVIVTAAGVSSFITTLGVGTALVGLNFVYNSGAPVTLGLPAAFGQIALRKIIGLPIPVIVMLAVALVLWVVLNRTVLGKNIQAVGGNAVAARLAGVRVNRTRIAALTICAVCASLAGILLASELGSGQYNAGDNYLLSAFAAAFLGTVAIRDGEFHIIGTLIGVLTVGIAFNGLALLGAPTYYQYLFNGGLLVVAVAVSTIARRALQR